jgi:2-polyprenyl-6-methoxyphenol hydroxylase-like FAD-dependent oxidoreductase
MSGKEPLHVIIAGGGIGGLALAQGLHQAGVRVSVYEKTVKRTDAVQGFRVHISPFGSAALKDCLPPHLFDAFVSSGGTGGNGFTFATDQLKQLLTIEPELSNGGSDLPEHSHYGISRITLRQILLAGLGDDIVHFDKAVTGYERNADGTVTARFADGDSVIADPLNGAHPRRASGDVLVGADGGASKIRAQYLPDAARVDTGIVGIAGKYLLTDANRDRLDPMLLRSPMTVMPPKNYGMFCAPHELDAPTDLLAAGIGGNDEADPGTLLDNTRSYLFWAFAGRRDAFDPSLGKLEALDGARLREIVLEKMADWSPKLRFAVAESAADTVTAIPILTSTPRPAWPTTNVTLLGDAIHSMTPFRGIGANTALRDAQLLSRELIAADRGERPLLDAIHTYESGMLDYGFAAVRTSMRAAQQFVAPGRAGRIMTNTVFRTFSAIPPLKRMAFADRSRR